MRFIKSGKKEGKYSDDDLLKEFTSTGELEVLGDLYSRYMHLVYGVCLKYLKDRDESMDAVMNIFEKLITELPKHKIENFRSWLHVVTKNYSLMQIRSKKSKEEKYKEWINDSGYFMDYGYDLHPVDQDDPDMEKVLADCIERLNHEQGECIRQFYYENKCYNEIAKNIDVDEKKVKSYIQNGKRNLKLCIEEKNERKRDK